jgi:uncharacterized protein with GYD domain
MAKYMVTASYTRDGLKGVIAKGGSARRDAVDKLVSDLGGRMESFHFGFGDHDAYVIVDLPDNIGAAAIAMAVGASGGAVVHTTVLLTPEEVDRAAQTTVNYLPPGG